MDALVEKVGDIQILHLRGRLDPAGSDAFAAQLDGILDSGANKIVLHCGDLEYVSSVGLRVFLSGARRVRPDGKLVLAALNPHVANVLKIAGLTGVFEIAASKEDAVSQLQA